MVQVNIITNDCFMPFYILDGQICSSDEGYSYDPVTNRFSGPCNDFAFHIVTGNGISPRKNPCYEFLIQPLSKSAKTCTFKNGVKFELLPGKMCPARWKYEYAVENMPNNVTIVNVQGRILLLLNIIYCF